MVFCRQSAITIVYAALATLIAVFHCIIAGTLSETGLMIIPPRMLKSPVASEKISMSVSPDHAVEMFHYTRDGQWKHRVIIQWSLPSYKQVRVFYSGAILFGTCST